MADPSRSPDVDQYIAAAPAQVRPVLKKIRSAIHDAVPGAGEKISYRIPTVTVDGKMLIFFAGFEHHVSVYPIPDVDEDLAKELAPFRSGKGTLKFPLDKPIPYAVIALVAKAHERRLQG
jgi:uncharacterized protein YdhG (YjbR/CyaY superfamily)